MSTPRWTDSDQAADRAKRAAWNAVAGDQVPHRAWYYSPDFQSDALAPAFLAELRDVFWSGATKSRVAPNVDVKADRSGDLPGALFLRVSMPDRLVTSFVLGGMTFVLYKALALGDRVVDFGREWGGLRGTATAERPMTVVGNLGSVMDGMDAPVAAALLRDAERKEFQPPAASPEATLRSDFPATAPAPPLPPADLRELPAQPRLPDPADADTDQPPPAPPVRPVPRRASLKVFGADTGPFGEPVAKPRSRVAVPPPAAEPPLPPGRQERPAPAPRLPATDDDPTLEDPSDRYFGIAMAVAVVVVLALGIISLSL